MNATSDLGGIFGGAKFFSAGFEEAAEFSEGLEFELADAGFGDAHFVADFGEAQGGAVLFEAVVVGEEFSFAVRRVL